MKALSIRQPWAHLILCGLKDVENRTWSTDYRGPLVIHAGVKVDPGWVDGAKEVTRRGGTSAPWWVMLEAGAGVSSQVDVVTTTKRGCILGIVDLVDVVTESDSPWFFGPYGWVLANPRVLPTPVPYRGRLRLFDVADSELEPLVVSTTQVRFNGATDVQANWGRGIDPRALLTVGAVYELRRVEEHDWHTLYHLVGIADNGRGFNSVCFELVEP